VEGDLWARAVSFGARAFGTWMLVSLAPAVVAISEPLDAKWGVSMAGSTSRRLVAGFLRMAPDVAIVGEVRDRGRLPELRADDGTAARAGTLAFQAFSDRTSYEALSK
jgi:hypothetical protein